jgi:hypothetical protein
MFFRKVLLEGEIVGKSVIKGGLVKFVMSPGMTQDFLYEPRAFNILSYSSSRLLSNLAWHLTRCDLKAKLERYIPNQGTSYWLGLPFSFRHSIFSFERQHFV